MFLNQNFHTVYKKNAEYTFVEYKKLRRRCQLKIVDHGKEDTQMKKDIIIRGFHCTTTIIHIIIISSTCGNGW